MQTLSGHWYINRRVVSYIENTQCDMILRVQIYTLLTKKVTNHFAFFTMAQIIKVCRFVQLLLES